MSKHQNVILCENAAEPVLQEAGTIKARVRRLSKEMQSLLADKALPESLRKQVETFSAALKKTWAELEREAGEEQGHRGVASKEAVSNYENNSIEEGFYGDEASGYTWVSPNITSFQQLDAAHAAREIAENMRARVAQFQAMMNNIFFWSSDTEVPDKIGAAQTLFDEFIQVVGDVLTGQDDEPDSIAGAAESAETFAESYAPAVTLVETDMTNPRGPLEMDVQLIQPGWGNSRDNHYYPADMLKRDARVFEGAKMYATDHKADEKSVRTEVSQIKSITGFTESGAPVARVIVFDPDFAEQARNRAKAGVLTSLECSILADGRARPGFEQGGRKGKVVEAITAVASVDWVTRAGAGGKALNLAESAEGAPDESSEPEAAPVEESAPVQSVAIAEGEETPPEAQDASGEAPEQEEPPVGEEETASEAVSAPSYLTEAEVRAALSGVRLPAESVLALAFGKWATVEALTEAVQAEVKRIKEVSGSGKPFAMGESAAAPVSGAPVSRAAIEETMDRINARFGIVGR